MNDKRRLIVSQDLGFDSLPRVMELTKIQPMYNRLLNSGSCGLISYVQFGNGVDFEAWTRDFSIDDYTDVWLSIKEFLGMVLDAQCSIKGCDLSQITLYDFSGGSLGNLLGKMECESLCCRVFTRAKFESPDSHSTKTK